MKFLVFGSINSDVLFSVDHIVTAGETISSKDVKLNAGGKGANQAAALGKSGLEVFFAGKCNENGRWILELLESFNVDTSLSILSNQVQTGQAIIQVDSKGQNSIILSPGGNDSFEDQEAESILSSFGEGDAIILQNEINITAQLIDMAKERKMTVFLNPSPFDSRAKNFDYNKVDYIFINEIEACGLADCQMNDNIDFGFCKNIGDCILTKYPEIKIILTLGNKGAYYLDASSSFYAPIFDVPVIDTTGAGDTFCGYFINGIYTGLSPDKALYQASAASSITVSREGAMASFPWKEEIEKLIYQSH